MRKERNRRLAGVLAVLLLLCGLLAGCIPGSAGEGGQEAGENTAQHASFWADGGEATLRVLSGSENRELEPSSRNVSGRPGSISLWSIRVPWIL